MVQISSQKNIKMFFSSFHIVLVANWLMDDCHLGYITILEGRKIFLINFVEFYLKKDCDHK